MSPLTATPAQRRTALILCIAFIWSIFIYGALVFIMGSNRAANPSHSADSLRPFLYGIALAGLIGSAIFSMTQLSSAPTFPIFQSKMIIGIALAETCSIVGLLLFFLGAPPMEFLYFGAGTIGVIVAIILPRLLSIPVSEKADR